MAFNSTSGLISEDQRAFSVKKLRKLKGNSPDKEYCEDDFETLASYRTRRNYAAGPLKSPLMQLNEMRKEVEYNVVSRTGPSHCPTFVAEVIVDGCAYEGKGISKQDARQNAAERALRHVRRYLPRPRERNQISESEEKDDHDDAPRMISLRADKLVLAVKDLTACHDLQGKVEVKGTFRLTLEDKRAFPVKKKLRKLKGNSPDKEYRMALRHFLLTRHVAVTQPDH
ncbi:Double-stranded RNA-specific editase 1 [Acropora cervicornis]|uniref:Double-stranded RNA-specific editase 1 n=1 Tax=Acropora cervicornis TaxID=6130 RepID=A0AAD9R0P2_ACRCE|nr:Double-stranded RNA-specific editase 1 [Acropora cervicornis]